MICKNKWPTFLQMSRSGEPRKALQVAESQRHETPWATWDPFPRWHAVGVKQYAAGEALRLSRCIGGQMTRNTRHSFRVYGAQNSKTIFRFLVPQGGCVCLVHRLTVSHKDGKRKGNGVAVHPGSLTAPASLCDLTCVRTLR